MLSAASAQMLFQPTDKFLNEAEVTDVPAFSDPMPGVTDAPFYDRTKAFRQDVAAQIEAFETPDLQYGCSDPCAYNYDADDALISFPLQMSCDDTGFLASELEFNI